MSTASGALRGVRVLDLTDERAIYGAKMLADLGADVVRPVPPGGDPLRQRGPFCHGASLWHAFFASNRRFVTADARAPQGESTLARLFGEADVALVCGEPFAAQAQAARRRHPRLVVVDVSSFGANGPWKRFLAPDLVAGALGGAVATTGDVETPPLKTFGELNFVLSGAYAAIAALAGLRHVRAGGDGQRVDVSVHECIASCLEHVFMFYWYHERMVNADGPVLPRRGSLHWSNAYCVMPAKDGAIMVTPTPNIDQQLVWLIEQEAQEDLLDPAYQEPGKRRALIQRLMEVLRGWVATREAQALFFEAQERHAPYGRVLPVDKVAENPQLEARNWWTRYPVAGGEPVRGPGAPYHFSATPWRIGASEAADGFAPRQAPAAKPRATPPNVRPLDGVRVLDFTHVLAGPFATRILGDMGADVVKVNSESRVATNPPNGIYYVVWNRNKRALALNMAKDESRALCKRLCERADVVIDNFSAGVLERWGVGYERVRKANPGVVYVQMSGMGDSGPWSKFVTYAPTIHALAGLTHLTGVPGRQDIGIGFLLQRPLRRPARRVRHLGGAGSAPAHRPRAARGHVAVRAGRGPARPHLDGLLRNRPRSRTARQPPALRQSRSPRLLPLRRREVRRGGGRALGGHRLHDGRALDGPQARDGRSGVGERRRARHGGRTAGVRAPGRQAQRLDAHAHGGRGDGTLPSGRRAGRRRANRRGFGRARPAAKGVALPVRDGRAAPRAKKPPTQTASPSTSRRRPATNTAAAGKSAKTTPRCWRTGWACPRKRCATGRKRGIWLRFRGCCNCDDGDEYVGAIPECCGGCPVTSTANNECSPSPANSGASLHE